MIGIRGKLYDVIAVEGTSRVQKEKRSQEHPQKGGHIAAVSLSAVTLVLMNIGHLHCCSNTSDRQHQPLC